MLGWIWRGLRTGVVTTAYPRQPLPLAGRTVPVITAERLRREHGPLLAAVCPSTALTYDGRLILDYGPCISCAYCAVALPEVVSMSQAYELAARSANDLRTIYHFGDADER